MKRAITFAGIFLLGCAGPARNLDQPLLVVLGFTSRESAGEDPVFDLSAAKAEMRVDPKMPGGGLESEQAMMNIEGVRFSMFRGGQKSGVVQADSGIFLPEDKSVELHGHVTYDALDDSFHVRSDKMAWDPRSARLICERDVEGQFRQFKFTADRLDMARSRNVFYLRNSTFIGPG